MHHNISSPEDAGTMTPGDAASAHAIPDPVPLLSGTTPRSVPSHIARHAASNPSRRRRGLLAELRTRLIGERIHHLTEETHRAPLMLYVLTATQSCAVVLILGHSEIPLLFSGSLGVTALMAAALGLLVATVVVADVCAIRTLRRLPVLARNRATFALTLHLAYLAFVLFIEVSTYALVLSVLDRDPQALLSSQPLVPPDTWIYWAQIVLRAVLLTWTAIQLYLVSTPLPLQWSTLDTLSLGLLGGHAKAALEQLELRQTDITSLFRAISAVSRRPPRRRTRWNGFLVRRDQEAEAAEVAHQEEVMRALEGLSQDHASERATERAALEQDRLAAQLAQREAKASVEHAHTEAMQAARARLAEAFLQVIATGKAPEWLVELAPDAAEILPTLVAKGRRTPSAISAHSSGQSATNAGTSSGGSLDDLRAILASMGLHEAQKPAGIRRGIWVKSSDIAPISGGTIKGEDATMLARRLGDGAKDGRAYIAPLEAVIAELVERNKVNESLRSWQNARRKRPDSADNAGPNAGPNAGAMAA